MDNRLRNCNFVKTLFMISVVVYHSVLFWNGKWFASVTTPVFSSEGLNILSQVLNTFHIYGFTLVSGYIFCYIKQEKGGYVKLGSFVRKKFTRLIVPYIFVVSIWVVPFAVYFFDYNSKAVLFKYALAVSPNQLWFLVMLFDVFLMAFGLSDLWSKRPMLGMIVVWGIYIVGFVAGRLFMDVFQIWTACTFLAYFWLGFYLRFKENGFLWKIPTFVYLLVGIALIVCLIYIRNFDSIIMKILEIGLDSITKIYGSIAAFILLQRLADRIKWESKAFSFISNQSMVVYLFHQQFIYVVLKALNGALNPWLHAGVNFLISFGLSIVIAVVMKKSKLLLFLLGES